MRRAYDVRRGIVRRYAPHEYVAVRLLLPAELHPPVVAEAYMHTTDELIDTGDVDPRAAALAAWDAESTTALESGEPPEQDALLALRDTARRHPHMAARVRAFLDGAPVEASWTGFETEADFQAYVDSYSLPGLMPTACLLAPAAPDAYESYVQGCRDLIEGWQRSDFLADLREDAENDRIGIPRDELARHGLKFDDLRSRPEACVPALDRVVRAQADLAGTTLAGCRGLPAPVAAEHRPFLDALIAVQELRLGAVRRAGGRVLLHDTGSSAFATLRVLVRQYRRARPYA
ncbi:squalene/phytoene synthase family protein [Streptomyces sp. NPDC050549]|uniref:squalene/phytoene synthase family protein n=1 Tax=Streptomyces sp. NPDC050549 TaxID=3155406 RepID=UPI003414929B